jgi:hypothetical protein
MKETALGDQGDRKIEKNRDILIRLVGSVYQCSGAIASCLMPQRHLINFNVSELGLLTPAGKKT